MRAVRFQDGVEWAYSACPTAVWAEFTAPGQSRGRFITRVLDAKPLADILQYVIRIADVLGVGLNAALSNKFEENSLRYPAEAIHGSAARRPRVSEVTTRKARIT